MVEFVVNGEREKAICEFETKMFAKYKEVIVPYSTLFEKAGCELKLEMGWCNTIRKVWSVNRISLRNGYACYIYCLIEKGGEEVRIKCHDGEADYYPMGKEWMISSVNRRFGKLKITLCEDLDDVKNDMKDLLLQLKHIE